MVSRFPENGHVLHRDPNRPHWAKTMLRPVYGRVWKTWVRLTEPPRGQYPIVHQGIQRSGTNFLSAILDKGDYRVMNRIDPARNDPRHKHFRWQADMSTVVMDERYRNGVTAQTLDDVNRICGYPQDMRHVVLFREPRDWLDGIFRWGIAHNWFCSEEEFLQRDLHHSYLAEWHAYYAEWSRLCEQDSDRVLLLAYSDLRRNPTLGLQAIDDFMKVNRSQRIDLSGGLTKVRHSKPIIRERTGLTSPAIDAAVAREGAFDWRRCKRREMTE